MSERKLPKNMSFGWFTGSKSFSEIITNPHGSGSLSQEAWKEAPPGQQLKESIFSLLFHKAIDLAKHSPNRDVRYVRYDIEGTPESENNRPFRENGEVKYMEYEGYKHHGKM